MIEARALVTEGMFLALTGGTPSSTAPTTRGRSPRSPGSAAAARRRSAPPTPVTSPC